MRRRGTRQSQQHRMYTSRVIGSSLNFQAFLGSQIRSLPIAILVPTPYPIRAMFHRPANGRSYTGYSIMNGHRPMRCPTVRLSNFIIPTTHVRFVSTTVRSQLFPVADHHEVWARSSSGTIPGWGWCVALVDSSVDARALLRPLVVSCHLIHCFMFSSDYVLTIYPS